MNVYTGKEGSVLVSLGDHGLLTPFPGYEDAITEVKSLLRTLQQMKPLEDWSHEDTRDLVAAVDHHMSLLPRGMEALVRMKWVRSTDAFHKYEECDDDDNLLAKSMRNIGTTYFKNDGSDSAPAPFIAVRSTPSPPMHQEVQSE